MISDIDLTEDFKPFNFEIRGTIYCKDWEEARDMLEEIHNLDFVNDFRVNELVEGYNETEKISRQSNN